MNKISLLFKLTLFKISSRLYHDFFHSYENYLHLFIFINQNCMFLVEQNVAIFLIFPLEFFLLIFFVLLFTFNLSRIIFFCRFFAVILKLEILNIF